MSAYIFNYTLSLSLTSLTTLILGIFVYYKNKNEPVNKMFCLFSLAVSAWSFFQIKMSLTSNLSLALFFGRIEHFAVILIPIFFLHFVFTLLDLNTKRKKWLIAGYSFVGLFLTTLPTKFFMQGVTLKPNLPLNMPDTTPVYLLFIIFFSICVAWALYELFRAYITSSGAKRNQMKYLSWSALMAFVGGSGNFLYAYGIEIPVFNPFGIYGVPLYVIIAAYAIIKYRLMDITVFVRNTVIYGMLYSLVMGGFVFLVVFFGQWTIYGKLDIRVLWMCALALFIITLSVRPLDNILTRLTDNILFRKKYEYQRTLRKASEGMARVRDLDRLLNLIVRMIVNSVRVTHATISLRDEESSDFVVRASRGRMKKQEGLLKIKRNDPLIERLINEKDVIVREELKDLLKATVSQGGKKDVIRKMEGALQEMEKLGLAMCVPSFIEGGWLLGFLMLGEKLSGGMYTQEDIDIFATLANQAAIAIDNAQAYEEIKNTKDQLAQAEKLASVGRLAGGIAHEIKNPLGSIKTFTEFLPEEYKDPAFRKKFCKIVGSEVDRINSIVGQLVDFSHPKSPKLEKIDAHQAIESVLALLENKLAEKKVKVEKHYTTGNRMISADKNQLKQVFLNLFINSLQAMPRTKKPKAANTLKITTKSNKASFIIRIADTGCGIPQESISSVFDPFFTTKEKGAGLGLSIVHGIIRSHGGSIDISSGPGKGTTFTIKLPVKITS